jgi:hypothetical protein
MITGRVTTRPPVADGHRLDHRLRSRTRGPPRRTATSAAGSVAPSISPVSLDAWELKIQLTGRHKAQLWRRLGESHSVV